MVATSIWYFGNRIDGGSQCMCCRWKRERDGGKVVDKKNTRRGANFIFNIKENFRKIYAKICFVLFFH